MCVRVRRANYRRKLLSVVSEDLWPRCSLAPLHYTTRHISSQSEGDYREIKGITNRLICIMCSLHVAQDHIEHPYCYAAK